MRVAAVIPAYNEERVVARVVAGVRPHVETVYVIDDASTDATAEAAAEAGAVVLRRAANGGQGAALADGLAAARDAGFDMVVCLDADGQHDSRDVPRLVAAVAARADVAVGSRLRVPGSMPFPRIAANALADLVTFALYGAFCTDSQSGFRAYSRRALERIRIRARRYEVCSWLCGEYRRRRLRVREVPIRTIYTDYSLSKGQSFGTGLRTLGRLVAARLREWW